MFRTKAAVVSLLSLAMFPALVSCSAERVADKATTQPPPAPQPEHHALENIFPVIPGLLSGSAPEDADALEQIRAMGVKTIISVDGAAPGAAAAQRLGMRYVHIPVTYATITDDQRLEIARAVRDLPGPVYVHCHHGKHRGPTAAAAAAITLGRMTPNEGLALMQKAGTAPAYTGLYACVRNAAPAPAAVIDNAPNDFPSIQTPKGLVSAMVEIDTAWENLGFIRKANWTTPADHPDLVPAAEAGRLADHFRTGAQSEEARKLGPHFLNRIKSAESLASALEKALAQRAPAEALQPAWAAVDASCKSCHAAYRN
jgi:protein tyrosine phosphatase (PTP) superfamily phosphohydrolase (DUF442 family)